MPDPNPRPTCATCDDWYPCSGSRPDSEGECHGGLPQITTTRAQFNEIRSRTTRESPLAGAWPVVPACESCACHSALKPAAVLASRRRGKDKEAPP